MEQNVEQQVFLCRDIKEAIAWRIQSGFYIADEIIDFMVNRVSNTTDMNIRNTMKMVRRIVATEWATQLEKQQTWPDEPTPSDKLEKAFSSLERNHKVLARMNQGCCKTCGREQVAEDRDDDTRGYVFFHEQETESIVKGGDLHLTFGSFTKSKKKDQEVGDVVVRSLRRAGLSVKWTGDPRREILVLCREWRRRIQSDLDIEDVIDEDFDTDCVSSTDKSESDQEPDDQSDLEINPGSEDPRLPTSRIIKLIGAGGGDTETLI